MAEFAIVCLAFFDYFIHHSARWIQVNNLIAKIRMDGSRIIKYVFKKEQLPAYSVWDEEEIDEFRKQSKTVVNAKHSGYVQEIRWNGMVEWARKHDYVIRSEEHTSELQSRGHLVCRLLLEKKKYSTHT